jgi:integrase
MIAQNEALTAVSGTAVPQIVAGDDKLALAGQLANQAAADDVFDEHLRHKSPETRKAYAAAVGLFSEALAEIGIDRPTERLLSDPVAWQGVTWAMVKGYRDWLLSKGYAIGSINQRLSILRKMADLAAQAGAIPDDERLKIRSVAGYTRKDGKRADEQRDTTRLSEQKVAHNFLNKSQVHTLLSRLPDIAQGRRDRLMLAMLVYLGLRVSELVSLSISDLDLVGGIVHVYRQKTDTESKIDMPLALREALRDYLSVRPMGVMHGRLLVASLKSGELVARPMSKRGVQARVQQLGLEFLDIDNLSPHDLRHTLAETFAAQGVSEAAAMDVLGWQTSAMYHHYRNRTKVVSVPDVWT